LIQSDGAKPSTSRGYRDEDDSSAGDEKSKLIKSKSEQEKSEEEKETEMAKKKKLLMSKLMLIPTFISSILVSLTLRLHRVSRSYRYVTRMLAREKSALKVFKLQFSSFSGDLK
jgi:hypothetical protein